MKDSLDALMNDSINDASWDYSHQAEYYRYRPNYAVEAINKMLEHVGAVPKESFLIADVGAGTANLTRMLLERGFKCVAVEPNASMRRIGMAATEGQDVQWMLGTGEHSGLNDASVDLFAMGSSFNTTSQQETLCEAHRTLKPQGWFSCLWNHRDLEDDENQARSEQIIREFFPDYSHGTRRNDQTASILSSGLFHEPYYIEATQHVEQDIENYINAWKSVRNQFWDLTTQDGLEVFSKISKRFRNELPERFSLSYTTRVWVAQRYTG